MFTNDKLSRITLKQAMLLITYTVVLFLLAMNYRSVLDIIKQSIGLLKPFLYGIALAYVFYLPMKYFLRKLPKQIQKGRTIWAAGCALLVILIVFAFIFNIVVPQVIDSITSLANALPTYIDEMQITIDTWMNKFDISKQVMDQIVAYSAQIQETLLNVVSNLLPQIVSATKGLTTSIANVFMALVIAVYILFSREKLQRQVKNMLYAFSNDKVNDYVLHIGHIANTIFAKFISGQLVEAIIIGVLCYIGCILLKIPYAPIVSVVIGCTNIIPIFGPIIGTAICGFLILFVSPIKAIAFVIFGICLQQFESNLIYPRVVGSSVGLSGLWVLFAITVGGGLFGLGGMVLGLPSFAVLYTLVKEEMNRRIALKQKRKLDIIEELENSL